MARMLCIVGDQVWAPASLALLRQWINAYIEDPQNQKA
ncbi:UNVERIFIED_ORG: hypothetical protein ABIB52_003505 [Arthrobacter sp. UYCu721]